MYVRIARFEGGTAVEIDTEGERIRRDFEAARRGDTTTGEVPSALTRLVERVEMLVDRERGSVAVCVYCDSEEKLREVDRIMDEMSPTSGGWGHRVSSDLYEVAFDETTSERRAA
jgi:hypothetical protein